MDTELNRAESELMHEETSLHGELARLLAVGTELGKRIKGIRFAAAEAAAKGVSDEAFDARIAALQLPEIDTEGPFSESRAARQAAVVARRAATQSVRDQVAELKQSLSLIATQVHADEKFVRRLSSLARRAKEADPNGAPVAPTPPSIPTPVPAAPPPRVPTHFDPRTERQSPRVKMQAVITLHSDNNFFNGFSSNISDGGIFVATVNLLPIGTPIDLAFSLPSGQRIEAHGVVRWVREINDQIPDAFPGLGIQFKVLQEPALEAISGFVSSREPLFYVE